MTGKLLRLFKGRGRLAREKALVQELPAVALAEVVRWFLGLPYIEHQPIFVARLIELIVDGDSTPMWTAYEFKSRNEAAWFFAEALKAYLSVSDEDRARIFAARTFSRISQNDLPMWTFGITKLFNSSESMIPHIASCLTETVPGTVDFGETSVQDPRYLQVAHALLEAE